jgi:hypothetical protein
MSEGSFGSDKGIGVTLAFAAVALVGGVLMYGHPTQIGKAYGFGTAFVFAVLAVVAVQVFE